MIQTASRHLTFPGVPVFLHFGLRAVADRVELSVCSRRHLLQRGIEKGNIARMHPKKKEPGKVRN